jgi:transaldolase
MTVVVADTGDIQSIEQFKPRDATTNPSLITAAAEMPRYKEIVDGTLLEARKELGDHADPKKVATLAFDRLAVAFGKRILQIVPKRVSTEVDARLSLRHQRDRGQRAARSSRSMRPPEFRASAF